MTMNVHPPVALSLDRLIQLARGIADLPSEWCELVEYRADRRWYRRLIQAETYEVWLLSWLPGQHTGFHDHGKSAGAFAVAAGSLSERVTLRGRPHPFGTMLATGAVRSFRPGHVHDVRNDWTERAVSVHVYSPPLTSMRRFGVSGDGTLRLLAEDRTW